MNNEIITEDNFKRNSIIMHEKEAAILSWLEDGYSMKLNWKGKHKWLKQFNPSFINSFFPEIKKTRKRGANREQAPLTDKAKKILVTLLEAIIENPSDTEINFYKKCVSKGVQFSSRTSIKYYVAKLIRMGFISGGRRKGQGYEIFKINID